MNGRSRRGLSEGQGRVGQSALGVWLMSWGLNDQNGRCFILEIFENTAVSGNR